jgi:ketosteroid isomerase-like protein
MLNAPQILELTCSQTQGAEMTKRSSLPVVLGVLSFILVMRCVAQQSPVEKEILALEEKMNAIYAANDLPNYFPYYADDFTQWLPEGRTDLPQYKKEWTAFIQGGGRVEANEISDMHIQIGPGGDTAVASYLAHVKTRSQKGKVSDETFHETDVWFKRAGMWKIVHLHYSPAPKGK